MILYIDCFQKKMHNLYFKKIIYKRKKIKNNYYSANKTNYNKNIKNNSLSNLTRFNSNIKDFKSVQKNSKILYSPLSPSLVPKNRIYKKIILPYINLEAIILIQKYVRGFLTRQKKKKVNNTVKKEIFLTRSAHPKRFQKKININIFDAIKANYRNQKKSIQMVNNRLNLNNTFNNVNNRRNVYKKNILLFNKTEKKNFSFALNRKKRINRKKILEVEFANDNNLSNSNNKESNLNTIKKMESSIPETEFSISNIFNEKCPQNINSNFENNTNENEDNLLNNLKLYDDGLFQNENIFQTEENVNINKTVKNNKSYTFINKNKKNKILRDIKNQCFFSSFKTKDNTSDRNLNSENSEINNKNKASEIIINKKKKNKIDKKINKNNKKRKNHIIEANNDILLTNECDSHIQGKNNKNNNFIKYNFNPLLNSKINKNMNKKNQSRNDYHLYSANKNDKDIINKKGNISESAKNKKNNDFDNDSKSSKSSFYEKDEFIIINYDYSLNDKKELANSLKISNVENINISGSNKKIIDFIVALKNIIYKIIYLYCFNILKNLKKFKTYDEKENEKSSITDNESCNNITERRIEKNEVIYNIAKNDMNNNKKIDNHNKKIMRNNTNFI